MCNSIGVFYLDGLDRKRFNIYIELHYLQPGGPVTRLNLQGHYSIDNPTLPISNYYYSQCRWSLSNQFIIIFTAEYISLANNIVPSICVFKFWINIDLLIIVHDELVGQIGPLTDYFRWRWNLNSKSIINQKMLL